MDATEVIDRMVKNFEPIMDPEDLKIVKDSYFACKDSLQNYLDTFYPPEEELEERAEAFVENIEGELDEGMKKSLRDAYIKNYNGELSMAKMLGVSEESLNTGYTLAYNSYNQGHYEEAKNYFDVLIFFDHNDPSFRFGLAASLHMMKEYAPAIDQYFAYICVNFHDPIPWYHLADCCIAMEDWDLALMALRAVIANAEGKKDYENIIKKSELMKDVVTKKLENLSEFESVRK